MEIKFYGSYLSFPRPKNRGGDGFHFLRVNCELAPRIRDPSNPSIICVYWPEESSKVTMSSLSITTVFSSVSRGSSSARKVVADVVSNDSESTEKSSQVVGPLS